MKKVDFVNDLAKLLSVDAKDIDVVVKHLGFDEIIDLIDAGQNNDKQRAAQILGIREDGGELSGISNILTSFEKGKNQSSRKEDRAPSPVKNKYVPSINDEVMVNGERGTVKLPNGPNGTVGVMIDGEMTMAKRSEVRPLRESTLGFTTIPSLDRMRELAGIAYDTTAEPTEAEPSHYVDVDYECVEVDQPCATCPLSAIQDAFDTIERNVGNLKIRDARTVRDRLNRVLTRLNESAAYRRKRL